MDWKIFNDSNIRPSEISRSGTAYTPYKYIYGAELVLLYIEIYAHIHAYIYICIMSWDMTRTRLKAYPFPRHCDPDAVPLHPDGVHHDVLRAGRPPRCTQV